MKSKKSVTLILLASSLLLLQGCMGGFGGKGSMGDRMFSRIDDDGNGHVDKSEYTAMAATKFERADDDSDGKVTFEEAQDNRFAKLMPEYAKRWFAENDLDGNGQIDASENEKASGIAFDESDANNDGKLSQKELETYRKNQRFNSMDRNSDGQITRDEYLDTQTPYF